MIQKTQNYYDGIARGYSELYHEEQIKKINLVESYINNYNLILDLGSGDGVLNNFVDITKLVAFDLSIELLKLNNAGKKVKGSILNLPFKDNSFDFICSFSVFQDLPDIDLAFTQVLKKLDTNGKFILSFIKFSSKREQILNNIEKYFETICFFEEEKDFIYVLKKKV